MRKYRLVAKKGEGTFSEVLKAQNVKDGRYHAIKCMKNRFDSIDQVNNLREIQALRRLSPHEHVITLEEVLYDQPTGRLALVFELMDANLYELIRGRQRYLNPQLVKSYMWQLMKSLDHMHRKGIFHRDIKPENILIESSTEIGRGLKLADFGSCRGIYSKQPYTEYISTRWYRAPECLLTDGYYGPEMDLWGAGCVMFEISCLYPLFPGNNEVDQITRIHKVGGCFLFSLSLSDCLFDSIHLSTSLTLTHIFELFLFLSPPYRFFSPKVLGTPTADVLQKLMAKGSSHMNFNFPPQRGVGIASLLQHVSAETADLITKLLKYDAAERISAREAMRHPYFRDIREAETKKAAGDGTQKTLDGTGTTQDLTASMKAGPGPLTQQAGLKYKVDSTPKNNLAGQYGSVQETSKTLPVLAGQSPQVLMQQQQLQAQQQQMAKQLSIQQQYAQQLTKSNAQKQQQQQLQPPPMQQVGGSAATTLPQISGIGNLTQQQMQQKYTAAQSTDRSQAGIPQVPKRRRKPRINYAQDRLVRRNAGQSVNAEQVMKAYGIPKSLVPISDGLKQPSTQQPLMQKR